MLDNGVVLLDKPKGSTSNHLLQRFKKTFGIRKVGHTGSLDPLATGMLPLCLGEATKFSQYLLDADKCYRAQGCLGVVTDTLDSDGSVIAQQDARHISQQALIDVCRQFVGEYAQIPPMYSALKHQGQPLYRLARQGQAVSRAPRQVKIFSLNLLEVDLPSFSFEVVCSKGTYIRSLIDDIGRALGVGAHLTALHRRYVAPFVDQPMVSLTEVNDPQALVQYLKPVDCMLAHLPAITLNPSESKSLKYGQNVCHNEPIPLHSLARVYDTSLGFLGLVTSLGDGVVRAKRLLSV